MLRIHRGSEGREREREREREKMAMGGIVFCVLITEINCLVLCNFLHLGNYQNRNSMQKITKQCFYLDTVHAYGNSYNNYMYVPFCLIPLSPAASHSC